MKKIASTLLNILDNKNMKKIIDLSEPIQSVIDDVISHWNYDLYSRKPGAAYTNDDVFVGTDLDLACFLFALAERNAVINIPEYKNRRAASITENEITVSKQNRHGKILAVLSNKENFAFSIRINDMNIITSDSVGNFRNFMMVDIDGELYDGWNGIEFMPTAKENDFLINNNIYTESSVVFKNFVHPNRWISFYGQFYFTTKALMKRLNVEIEFINDCINELKAKGIRLPRFSIKEWPKKTIVGESQSIKINVMEAEIEMPDFINNFSKDFSKIIPNFKAKNEVEILKALMDRKRELTYTILPKLQFATRATELAFFKHGENGNKLPTWIEDARWDRKFVQTGKRKKWNRLVFKRGIALRYRIYEKSEIVSK